jgi:hypothetical protein
MSTPRTTSPAELSDYVLPAPPRVPGELLAVAPSPVGASARRRGGDIARRLGERFAAAVAAEQQFLAELRARLVALDAASADASRAQWKGAVQDALAVVDWCDTVQHTAALESAWASAGCEPLDVAELCCEVAAELRSAGLQVLVQGRCEGLPWLSATAVGDLVRQSVLLVTERVAGGAVAITVAGDAARFELHFAGNGEPTEPEATTVQRFRSAVAAVQATVRPDGLGPNGVGFCVDVAAPAAS